MRAACIASTKPNAQRTTRTPLFRLCARLVSAPPIYESNLLKTMKALCLFSEGFFILGRKKLSEFFFKKADFLVISC